MKKLLFISKNLDTGGMEKALLVLLNNLVKRDYDITLILEEKKGVWLDDLDSNIKVKEYKLSTVKISFIRKTINFLHKTIWKITNKNKFDFACNFATYSLIGCYLAKVASSNNALYVHSNYYEAFKHNKEAFISFFDSLGVSEFKNIIFVSNEGRESFNEIYPKLSNKTTTINNQIDYKEIIDGAKEKLDINIDEKKMNFLFVGRLDNDSKNFIRMLKAFSIAINKKKSIRLYIVGDGKDGSLVDSLIKKYGLVNNVFMIGERPSSYKYIKACDCFLLTSNYEGYPVVFSECLALNAQVISTINVSDDYINMQDYINIVEKDEDKIAKAILRIKKDKKDYKINFDDINKKRIDKLISIIEDN